MPLAPAHLLTNRPVSLLTAGGRSSGRLILKSRAGHPSGVPPLMSARDYSWSLAHFVKFTRPPLACPAMGEVRRLACTPAAPLSFAGGLWPRPPRVLSFPVAGFFGAIGEILPSRVTQRVFAATPRRGVSSRVRVFFTHPGFGVQ